jgi:hypothetical protein
VLNEKQIVYKTFFKNRFIVLFVAVLFATCYSDDEIYYLSGDDSRRNTAKDVMSARQWYYANVEELSIKANSESGLQIDLKPQWEDAVVRSNIRTTTVEMPVAGKLKNTDSNFE